MFAKHFLFLCLFLLIACSPKKKATSTSSHLKYAKNIKIETEINGTKIELINPKTNSVSYFFLGKTKPSNLEKQYTFIQVPVKRIITLSGTDIGMLSKLAAEDKIVGVADESYVYNKKVKQNCKTGHTTNFGDASTMSYEKIIQSKANCIIFSGFENEFPHEKQLNQAHISCIPNYDWKENHPLGKAEWIRLIGILIGKEQQANNYFKFCETAYLDLKKSVQKLPLSKQVFVGNLIGDTWFTHSGKNYFAQLLTDAKANYTYKNTNGTESLSYSFEKIMRDNQNSEFWFNPGATSLLALANRNPKIVYFKAFKKNQVYCYSKNQNYFWEMSAIEPHLVLSDLICILHPTIVPNKTLHYYTQIH
jgi:iron complex transport system substrate-binding protein